MILSTSWIVLKQMAHLSIWVKYVCNRVVSSSWEESIENRIVKVCALADSTNTRQSSIRLSISNILVNECPMDIGGYFNGSIWDTDNLSDIETYYYNIYTTLYS